MFARINDFAHVQVRMYDGAAEWAAHRVRCDSPVRLPDQCAQVCIVETQTAPFGPANFYCVARLRAFVLSVKDNLTSDCAARFAQRSDDLLRQLQVGLSTQNLQLQIL